MALRPRHAREPEAIVIGASAGGVEALGALFASLPAGFRPAVLAVLHLAPDRPSGLAELFAPRCKLPLSEAMDKQPIEPGHVLLAPPDYHLLVEPGRRVALSVDAPVLYSRPAIDPLFESAALVYGEALLALLLTGASRDGSEGLAVVRAQGGRAWVQQPEDADSPTMPAAGLERAGADEVLTLEDMCGRFARGG